MTKLLKIGKSTYINPYGVTHISCADLEGEKTMIYFQGDSTIVVSLPIDAVAALIEASLDDQMRDIETIAR